MVFWIGLVVGWVFLLGQMAWADCEQGQRVLRQQLAHEQQRADVHTEQPTYLRPAALSGLWLHPCGQARGTVLLLHGYTAGTWQLPELAEQLFASGFHVYAPRLPGHGVMTPERIGTGQELISAWDVWGYERFLETIFAAATALEAPVHAVGLSGGGNLTLRLAERYPSLQRSVVMAPFVGPNYPQVVGMQTILTLNQLTLNGLSLALAAIPYNENEPSLPGEEMPHTQGNLSNVLAIYRMGALIGQVHPQIQFVTTEGDGLSGHLTLAGLYLHLGGESRHSWYHYRTQDQVPHAMISPRQNPHAAHLHQLIIHWLTAGTAAHRPPDDGALKREWPAYPLPEY